MVLVDVAYMLKYKCKPTMCVKFVLFCYHIMDYYLLQLQLLCFRLYRVNSESEALQLFNNFSYQLTALMTACHMKLLSRDWLQQFCDLLRSNPGWTVAHVAARMSLSESFKSEFVSTYVLF